MRAGLASTGPTACMVSSQHFLVKDRHWPLVLEGSGSVLQGLGQGQTYFPVRKKKPGKREETGKAGNSFLFQKVAPFPDFFFPFSQFIFCVLTTALGGQAMSPFHRAA